MLDRHLSTYNYLLFLVCIYTDYLFYENLIPYAPNVTRRLLWFMVSNARDKSKKIPPDFALLSRSVRILSQKDRIASCVDLFFVKPNCLDDIKFCFAKKDIS